MTKIVVVVTALALTGCAGTSSGIATGSTANAYPATYRNLVQQYTKQAFFDPYSVRDAEIAEPKKSGGPILVPGPMFAEVWVVCVRANAKNRMGAYTGMTETAFLIYDNRVVNTLSNPSWSWFCSDAKYQPFPEITQAPGA